MATETVSHGAAENVSACVNAHGGAVGMPQLCGDWMGNQVFWLVITLVLIYLILSRVALPRIASVLADRAGTITNDLAQAEELKQQAAEAEIAYEKALVEARAEAQRIAAETKAEIQVSLDEAIRVAEVEISAKAEEGEARIADIRAGALASVRDVARDTAAALVEALGSDGDAATIDKAVDGRLQGDAS